ncbi:MAG: GNAT family N-acetyltransferase [Acidobacteria bacterium]|nr:GNAT family N-acetyltransferase [Acidobacteriota bacterium]
MLTIETPRLRLVLEPVDRVLARIESLSAADRALVSPVWLARLRTLTEADPWTCGFVAVLRDEPVVVGSCGFKHPPGDDGVVEIAYGVDPEFQRRGLATEMATRLTTFAFEDPRVRIVIAHTLPEAGASPRVLTKSGFTHTGTVADPEDGPVWRWERRR